MDKERVNELRDEIIGNINAINRQVELERQLILGDIAAAILICQSLETPVTNDYIVQEIKDQLHEEPLAVSYTGDYIIRIIFDNFEINVYLEYDNNPAKTNISRHNVLFRQELSDLSLETKSAFYKHKENFNFDRKW